MGQIVVRDLQNPMVEFILRCTDNKIWISIESLATNKLIENRFKDVINDGEANKLCKDICREIEKIFNINTNRTKMINLINAINKKERKLTLITLYMFTNVIFDDAKGQFIHKSELGVETNDIELQYIENNNEYAIFLEYLNENRNKIFKLANILYYSAEKYYSD